MGERKVLNKYFPPDWDPSRIPRGKKDKTRDQRTEVRMMLPFSMCCNVCGCYMYRGKKFNSKKEVAEGEDYLGIKRIRFYIKCVECNNEITFKTDPKNSDYECEKVRNLPLSLEGHPHAPPSTHPMLSTPFMLSTLSMLHACPMHAPCMPRALMPHRTRRPQHVAAAAAPKKSRAAHDALSSCARHLPIAFIPHTTRSTPHVSQLRSYPHHAERRHARVHLSTRPHTLSATLATFTATLSPTNHQPTTNQPPPRTTR